MEPWEQERGKALGLLNRTYERLVQEGKQGEDYAINLKKQIDTFPVDDPRPSLDERYPQMRFDGRSPKFLAQKDTGAPELEKDVAKYTGQNNIFDSIVNDESPEVPNRFEDVLRAENVDDSPEVAPENRFDKVLEPPQTLQESTSVGQQLKNVGDAVQYGYYSSVAGFYNILANIPGGINNLNDWLVEKTGTGVESKETVLQYMEDYLRSVSRSVSPAAQNIPEPKGVVNKIYAGIAAAPVAITEYLGLIKWLGWAGGFAAHAGIENVDEPIGDIAVAMGKEAALGKVVQGANYLRMPERIAAMTMLGFGTTEGELEDKVAAGVTWAALSTIGPREGISGKEAVKNIKPGKPPEISPLMGEYKRMQGELSDINRTLSDPRTPEGLKEGLIAAKKDKEIALRTLEDGLYTEAKLSTAIYGQDLRNLEALSTDLKNPDGTPKYKDLNAFQKEVVGKIVPGKFMDNPVVKWAVDRMSRHRVQIEHNIDRILHHPVYHESQFGLSALRAGVAKPSERGALTAFEKLDSKAQKSVLDTLFMIEREAKMQVGPKEFERAGLKGQEVEAAMGLQRGAQMVLDHYNNMAKRYGDGKIKPIEDMPNYLPHMFMGNFRVFVNNKKTGNTEYVYPANNPIQARTIKSRLGKVFKEGEYDINFSPVKLRTDADVAVSAFSEAVKLMQKTSPEAVAAREVMIDVLARRGFGKHKMKRGGAGGFAGTEKGRKGVTSFLEGYKAYVEGGVKAAEGIKIRKEMADFYMDKNVRRYPNAVDYAQTYVNNALGHTGKITQVIQDVTRSWVGERGVAQALGGLNNATLYAKLLFGNARFIMAQGIQPYQVIPAKLADLQIKGVDGRIAMAMLKAHKDFVAPSAETKILVRYALQNRTIEPKFLSEFAGEHLFEKGLSSVPKKIWDTITLRNASARMEQYSRLHSTLMFYHFLRDAGKSKSEARQQASYLTDKYMVEYNHFERPLIYGETGLGVAGKPLGLFKTFQHNYLSQLTEHVKTAKQTGEVRGLTVFATGMVLTAGLQGVIAIEQADALLSALGAETLTSRLLRSDAPDWALWGVPSATTGVDITSTLAAPGLAPSDLVSAPSLEYVGKSIAGGFEWAKKSVAGTATPADATNFLKNVAPTSMHGWIERYFQRKDGLYRDPRKRDIGVLNRDVKDWVSRYLSGRSLKESLLMKTMYEISRVERRKADDQQTIIDTMTWLVMNGEEIPDVLVEKSIENGFGAKQIKQSIYGLIERQSLEMKTRMEQCKASIKCMQRMEMLDNYLSSRYTEYDDGKQ